MEFVESKELAITVEKKSGPPQTLNVTLPEDDAKRGHDTIDRLTKKYEGLLEGLMAAKSKEVTEL